MDGEVDHDTEVDSGLWRAEVGRLLKVERLRRGLEVADVADRLKLRSAFVVAVEDGRGHEFMDETYEWSHIKSIAAVLNVDVEMREQG